MNLYLLSLQLLLELTAATQPPLTEGRSWKSCPLPSSLFVISSDLVAAKSWENEQKGIKISPQWYAKHQLFVFFFNLSAWPYIYHILLFKWQRNLHSKTRPNLPLEWVLQHRYLLLNGGATAALLLFRPCHLTLCSAMRSGQCWSEQ